MTWEHDSHILISINVCLFTITDDMFIYKHGVSRRAHTFREMSFKDRVVLVTGGSSGIGAAAAILFAKEGANVAIVARNQTKLEEVAKEIETHGAKALIIKADLSKEEEIATVIPRTIENFGRLDVLVNNAGISVDGSILSGNLLEAYDAVMQTNVRSVIQLSTAAAPYLIESKGNIINISSILAVSVSSPNITALHLSKAALDHFTRCAALELASSGVRVNSVNPGPVDNDFLAKNGPEGDDIEGRKKALVNALALGYVATNEEVGELILFLASDKARSVTGSAYFMDNGYLLKN